MTQKTHHEWSKEALFSKAQSFADQMLANVDDDSIFGLWSALTLELLIRSAISATSPALVADSRDWLNILYAIGGTPKRPKFVPRSASTTDLLGRAEELVTGFSREHVNFCASHFARRNAEVHTGGFPFGDLGSAEWLPLYYSVCDVLCVSLGESLETLFGAPTAKQAREDIAALLDENAKAVKKLIAAFQTAWSQKNDQERALALAQAEAAQLRHFGHRVECPSCSSVALLSGVPMGEARRSVDDDGITERQVMKPETFSCIACGLRIQGFSKLFAAGLGNTFLSTSHYDAVEYFDIDVVERAREMMEDDNNEY